MQGALNLRGPYLTYFLTLQDILHVAPTLTLRGPILTTFYFCGVNQTFFLSQWRAQGFANSSDSNRAKKQYVGIPYFINIPNLNDNDQSYLYTNLVWKRVLWIYFRSPYNSASYHICWVRIGQRISTSLLLNKSNIRFNFKFDILQWIFLHIFFIFFRKVWKCS